MSFNSLKATKLRRGDNLLFTTKSPGDPDIDLTDLWRMKAGSTLKHLVVSNSGFMDTYEWTTVMTLGPKVVALKFDQV